MNMKPLPGIICILLLAGCTKLSSIDGRKNRSCYTTHGCDLPQHSLLTGMFCDELTLDITEEEHEMRWRKPRMGLRSRKILPSFWWELTMCT